MITRHPAAAAKESYDVIVAGGGICGVALTLEAARRGLSVLLLERDDFGGATSWNSLRILHGGLRYLQSLDLRRYRESVAERHWFMRHFPDLVVSLRCLMPLYGKGLRRPGAFAAAFALDDWLSRHRNDGLPPPLRLAAGRTITPAEAARIFPGVDPQGLRGAALWQDALMPESPRVLIEMLHWAAACGARALNYTEVTGLSVEHGRVTGVTARDRETGLLHLFRSPRLANCAGPWSRELAAMLDRDVPELFRPTVAFNLLLDRTPPADVALALSPPGRDRSFFLVPWGSRLMAGTYHGEGGGTADSDPAELHAGHPLVAGFLDQLNEALPSLELGPQNVLRILAGRLPAAPGDPSRPASRSIVRQHARQSGPAGLVSISGVKYTTARSLAEEALAVMFDGSRLPRAGAEPRPVTRAWPSAAQLLADQGPDPELSRRLRKLAERESVVHLDDLLLRRTDLGLDPTLGRALRERVASLLGPSSRIQDVATRGTAEA